MRGETFIFDNVVHMYDNRPSNTVGQEGRDVAAGVGAIAEKFSGPGFPWRTDFATMHIDCDEAYRLMFEESETDMVMAQSIPVFGWFREGFSPVAANYEFARRYPERVLFCGAVDPVWQGVGGAVEEMERQIVELGAKSFKFYQAQRGTLHWRADDRKVAYPMYETCLTHGVKNVRFHKGFPLGPQPLDPFRCDDLEQAALDFPEMRFVIHHLGAPYMDQAVNIAACHQNIWMALSAWINMHPIWPRESLHQLGKLLFWVGPDRLMYGSEAFVWPKVQAYIELLDGLEMPEELQEQYGYPPLTLETKKKIFGENFANLLGLDIEAKKHALGLVGTEGARSHVSA